MKDTIGTHELRSYDGKQKGEKIHIFISKYTFFSSRIHIFKDLSNYCVASMVSSPKSTNGFFFTEITNFYYNHYLILRFELGRSASTMKILCQINVNGIFKISRSTTLLKEDKNKNFNIYAILGPQRISHIYYSF